jgi:holo-[acyl-carrier protein] synthase
LIEADGKRFDSSCYFIARYPLTTFNAMIPSLRTGIDLIEIDRFENAVQRHGDRFLERVFTSRELSEVGEKMASLAARFAAKEAVSKALGTGIGSISWREIEILRGPSGEPTLVLHGEARRLSQDLRLESWSISLSHSHTHAIAMVVGLGLGEV